MIVPKALPFLDQFLRQVPIQNDETIHGPLRRWWIQSIRPHPQTATATASPPQAARRNPARSAGHRETEDNAAPVDHRVAAGPTGQGTPAAPLPAQREPSLRPRTS